MPTVNQTFTPNILTYKFFWMNGLKLPSPQIQNIQTNLSSFLKYSQRGSKPRGGTKLCRGQNATQLHPDRIKVKNNHVFPRLLCLKLFRHYREFIKRLTRFHFPLTVLSFLKGILFSVVVLKVAHWHIGRIKILDAMNWATEVQEKFTLNSYMTLLIGEIHPPCLCSMQCAHTRLKRSVSPYMTGMELM